MITPPMVVMVAPTGAQRSKAEHPKLPLSAAEIAAEAERCVAAGATALHLHVRTGSGDHSLNPALYRAALAALKATVGERMVIQITTEAVGRYQLATQMRVVEELRPEAVSLTLRELVPDSSAADQVAPFLRWLVRQKIAPQYVLHEPAEVERFQALHRQGVIPQRQPFVLFLLGRKDGQGASPQPRDLLPFLAHQPAEQPWAVAAFGRIELAVAAVAAGLGGHVRVGFEQNLLRADGRPADSNAELVEQVALSARLLGRPRADIATTRRFLAATAA